MVALLRPWSSSIGAQVEAPKLRRVLSRLILNCRTALDARARGAGCNGSDRLIRVDSDALFDRRGEMQPGGVSHTSLVAEFGV